MRGIYRVFFLLILFVATAIKSTAQTADSTAKVIFSGYVDAYYAHYTDSVGIGNYQKFASNDARSRQFGLNTAAFTAQYDGEKVRGIVTLFYGDLPKSAWSATYNNIMEAHAGVRLGKKVWLDAGFFRTHTGAEALFPKENFTTCISISTLYEPYYEAGIKLNYKPSDRWDLNFHIVNGYGIYEDNNNKKSVGILATYTVSDKLTIGYSNCLGDDTPLGDTITHFRNFENLFVNYQIGKLKMVLGLDFVTQQHSDTADANKSASYFSGVLNLKYQFTDKFAIYGRGEAFNDPQGFMGVPYPTGSHAGYKLFGATEGMEFKPTSNSYFRIEERQLVFDKTQELFYWNGELRNYRVELLLNMGISF